MFSKKDKLSHLKRSFAWMLVMGTLATLFFLNLLATPIEKDSVNTVFLLFFIISGIAFVYFIYECIKDVIVYLFHKEKIPKTK